MKYFIVLLFSFLLYSCNNSNPVSPPPQQVQYSHFRIFESFGIDSARKYTMLMIEDSIKYVD